MTSSYAQGMNSIRTLVVFYSRTGTTKKVAEAVSNHLECDLEEIIDKKKRTGILGYLRSGFDAKFKRLTVIEPFRKDPASYDLAIIGTPIWASAVSSATRTYVSQNKDRFKKVAFFYTCGDSNGSAFQQMEELCAQKPSH